MVAPSKSSSATAAEPTDETMTHGGSKRFMTNDDGGGAERRSAPRVDVCTTAVVLARHNDGIAFTIESLSISGARMVGPLTLDRGERVTIMFEAAGHPIEVRGEVVRVERQTISDDRVAIRLVELSDETRDAIRRL